MKKTILVMLCILGCLTIVSCGKTTDTGSQTTPTAQATLDPGSKESNKYGDNEDMAKAIEYIDILGFDKNSNYAILDLFAVEGSGEKSILMDIYDVSQERFDSARETMEDNGCYLVSDIMSDEQKRTKSYQYRNSDDTLYIEMVYSMETEYINIIFQPIVNE